MREEMEGTMVQAQIEFPIDMGRVDCDYFKRIMMTGEEKGAMPAPKGEDLYTTQEMSTILNNGFTNTTIV
jgi:hypothetical protein